MIRSHQKSAVVLLLFSFLLCSQLLGNEEQRKHANKELENVSSQIERLQESPTVTEPARQKLEERKQILSEIVDAINEKGFIPDTLAQSQIERFFRLRLLDSYRLNSKDDPELKKEVLVFLTSICEKLSRQEQITYRNMETADAFIKKGSKDPLVSAIKSLFVTLPTTRNDIKKTYWAEVDNVIKAFEESAYSPSVKLIGYAAKARMAALKKLALDLDAEQRRKCRSTFHEKLIEALKDESHCPENRMALNFVFGLAVDSFEAAEIEPLIELAETTGLEEWMKLSFQQRVYSRLIYKEWNEHGASAAFARLNDLHKACGLKAHRSLPLSQAPAALLMAQHYLEGEGESCRKWFEIASKRRPGCFWLNRAYMTYVINGAGGRTVEQYFEELANSENEAAGVPWMAFELIEYASRGRNGDVFLNNKKVAGSFAKCVDRAEKAGFAEGKVKRWRQLLHYMFLKSGDFKSALPVARKLEGDFGTRNRFKGQALTIARVATLGSDLVARVQLEVEKGELSVVEVEKLLNDLVLTRMDYGPEASTYIDELSDMLESIRKFENGEWASLSSQNEFMSAWRGVSSYVNYVDADQSYIDPWSPLEDGIKCVGNYCWVAWRWPVRGPYILEADIESRPLENYKKDRSHYDGFSISRSSGYPNPWQGAFVDGNQKTFFFGKKASPENMFTESGVNRLRVRVWEDYTEVTINGLPAGQYVVPTQMKGFAILHKNSQNSEVSFRNIRIRKLQSEPPLQPSELRRLYWTGRLSAEPDAADVWMSRGKATLPKKQLSRKAIKDFEKANELAGNSPATVTALAAALIELKKVDDANSILKAAVEKFPNEIALRCQWALVLATKGHDAFDANLALEQAYKARDLTPGYQKWKTKELVAVAYAAKGDFESAVRYQKGALDDRKDDWSRALVSEALECYRNNRMAPYRSPDYFHRYFTPSQNRGERKPVQVVDGLVGLWDFDHDTTNALTGKRCGVYGSPELIEGIKRGCILINASDKSQLLIAEGVTFDASKPFSMTFWIKPFERDGQICSLTRPPGSEKQGGLFVGVESNRVYAKISARKFGLDSNIKKQHKRFNWSHIGITYDGSGTLKGIQMFLNGQRKAMSSPDSKVGEDFPFEEMVFQFGGSQGKLGLGCQLDEFRIYDRLLSDEEIAAVKSYSPD